MKKIINKYKSYIVFIFIVIISNLLLSLLNLFSISNSITNILSMIVLIITYFIYGLKKGKISNNKGYIQGLKVGSILSLILLILSIFNLYFSIKTIIYYLILILSSIFGSTIGINKKK